MKRFLTLCAVLTVGASAFSQQYSVDYYKIGGGGGTSTSTGTNGQFTVNGTVAQPDAAGPATGGNYSVTGGFWTTTVVPTTGAPTLGITTTNNQIKVYWPSPSAGFSLQTSPDLVTPHWTTLTDGVQDNGVMKFILTSPVNRNRFYRLQPN